MRARWLVLAMLGLGCQSPIELPFVGPALSEGTTVYLIDGQRRIMLRLRPERLFRWSSEAEQPIDPELWVYRCEAPLPVEVPDWGPLPECLPPPNQRLLLDAEKTGWVSRSLDEPTPAPLCDACTLRPTSGLQLNLPDTGREMSFAAATWLDDDSALLAVHNRGAEPPLSSLWWIGPSEVRALETELPSGRAIPRLGALGRSGGELIAMGDGIWRLGLEPSSAAPNRVIFSLASDTTTTASGLGRAQGGVWETPWGATLLAGGNGGLYQRTGGPLRRLLDARQASDPNARDGHLVSFAAFDAAHGVAVGPGSWVLTDGANRVAMTHYLALRPDHLPEPHPLPMRVLPLATIAHRGQVFVLDRAGALWRLADLDDPQLLRADLLNEGWLGALGDRLLVTGKNGYLQSFDPRLGLLCPSTLVPEAATILSGEDRALLVADEALSVTWVTNPVAVGCGPDSSSAEE